MNVLNYKSSASSLKYTEISRVNLKMSIKKKRENKTKNK